MKRGGDSQDGKIETQGIMITMSARGWEVDRNKSISSLFTNWGVRNRSTWGLYTGIRQKGVTTGKMTLGQPAMTSTLLQ